MSGPLRMRVVEKLAAKSSVKLPGRGNALVMNWVAKQIDIPFACPTTVQKSRVHGRCLFGESDLMQGEVVTLYPAHGYICWDTDGTPTPGWTQKIWETWEVCGDSAKDIFAQYMFDLNTDKEGRITIAGDSLVEGDRAGALRARRRGCLKSAWRTKRWPTCEITWRWRRSSTRA